MILKSNKNNPITKYHDMDYISLLNHKNEDTGSN